MKTLGIILIFVFVYSNCYSQSNSVGKLKNELANATHDTTRVWIMANICNTLAGANPDSGLYYGENALALARKIKFTRGEIRILSHMSGVYTNMGNLPKGLSTAFEALQIAENNNLPLDKQLPFVYLSVAYRELNEIAKSIRFRKKAMNIAESTKNMTGMGIEYQNVGLLYVQAGKLDSASYYFKKSLILSKDRPISSTYRGLGDIQSLKGNFIPAIEFYRKALSLATLDENHRWMALTYLSIARLYKRKNQRDSSIYYARKTLSEASIVLQKRIIIDACSLLSELYEPADTKESYKYYKLATTTKEGLFGAGNIQAIQAIIAQEEERQKEIENAKIAFNNQLKLYALLAVLAILLLVAFFLYRNSQKEKKAKNLLQEKNKEIQSALSKLKSTQTQLIQSEKLASLGELTAGIAHEIQNPLNFVNNFSELSIDLANELWEERKKKAGERDEELIDDLVSDLTENQKKINLHVKRASSIVRGMLEHSKASTGQKELTDINTLAEEYLRLAYHGLKAKDNLINVIIETHFDETIPKIEVIPQDVGRVLLNLLNNAFYAIVEKSRRLGEDYQSLLTVTTKYIPLQGLGVISIKDNGIGMSEATKAKIFQPFFTTKPTGQGTGLGLSLAYDIVTKGHGGTIDVESKEGEGTTFIIKLPIYLPS